MFCSNCGKEINEGIELLLLLSLGCLSQDLMEVMRLLFQTKIQLYMV